MSRSSRAEACVARICFFNPIICFPSPFIKWPLHEDKAAPIRGLTANPERDYKKQIGLRNKCLSWGPFGFPSGPYRANKSKESSALLPLWSTACRGLGIQFYKKFYQLNLFLHGKRLSFINILGYFEYFLNSVVWNMSRSFLNVFLNISIILAQLRFYDSIHKWLRECDMTHPKSP